LDDMFRPFAKPLKETHDLRLVRETADPPEKNRSSTEMYLIGCSSFCKTANVPVSREDDEIN
jgi:hypothetical protein